MKKYAPYILILIVLVGLFSPMAQVHADTVPYCTGNKDTEGNPLCYNPDSTLKANGSCPTGYTPAANASDGCYNPSSGPDTTISPAAAATAASQPAQATAFQNAVNDQTCWSWDGLHFSGCLVQASYYIFYTIPAYLLWAAAYFFDVLIFITLNSTLLAGSGFIQAGWTIVRDLSNIFFILVLLYIAIRIILDMGGHDVKKMITTVIIMALLINFSMFFTEVVIDASNIIALIFYNKLAVSATNSSGQPVPISYDPVLVPYVASAVNNTPILGSAVAGTVQGGEKDVAGALTAAFDPTSLLNKNFFDTAGQQCSGIPNTPCVPGNPSASIIIGITLIAGALMFFAAYAFFVAGISFVGRLVELWVLIIFSPFAFMSFSVPLLEKAEYIGWDAWSKRLIKVSFMAPIFMFFMYFIFLMLQKGNPFGGLITNNQKPINTILLVVIPAVVILLLLLKATEFAKKGGGKLGEFASAAGKMIGGATLGVVTGGAALAGSTIIGGAGGAILNKTAAGAERMGLNRVGSGLRNVSDFARRSSFDVRGVKIAGQTLAGATGIPMGEAQKGGFAERKKEQVEKRRKRAEVLEQRGTARQRKNLEEAKAKLNEATLPIKVDLENADKVMEKFRKDLNDAQKSGNVAAIAVATSGLNTAKATKKRIKDSAGGGVGLDTLERGVHGAQKDLDTETGRIAGAYAKQISGGLSKTLNFIFRGYSMAGADEAARRIRSGAKVVEEKH